MASLMEDFIGILEEEADLYKQLLGLSSKKTPVIIAGDLNQLSTITDEEQGVVASLAKLDRKRLTGMQDIAIVLNKDVKTLKLTDLVQVLENRPKGQERLAAARDRLKMEADRAKRVNDQNQMLLQSSLEMVQFEMNILHGYYMAPETANYTKAADTSGDSIGMTRGSFDAKQ